MGSETRVCPRLIGWVVVEEFAGMIYFFSLNYYIIVIDTCRSLKIGHFMYPDTIIKGASLHIPLIFDIPWKLE